MGRTFFFFKVNRKMSNFLLFFSIFNQKYCHVSVSNHLNFWFIFPDAHNILRVAVIALSCIVFVLLVVIGVLIWRIRRAEPNNRTTTANKIITNAIGQSESARAQHMSEPGVYMELGLRPTDGQSPAEYQTLQGTHVTSGYYNVGFKGRRKKKEDQEVYEEVGNNQC